MLLSSVQSGAVAATRKISQVSSTKESTPWHLLMAVTVVAVCMTVGIRANATTYVGTRDIDGATVNLSITTDGTVGDLTDPNITAFNVSIKDAGGTADITNANGEIQISNDYSLSDLVATRTTLSFTGSDCLGPECQGGDNVLFQQGSLNAGGAFYCLQANGCYDYSYNGEGASSQATVPINSSVSSGVTASEQVSQSGTFVFANAVSAVPEPGTWALMLGGFGVLGYALRRRAASGMTWARLGA
jgi:hypothetical protein